MGHRLAAGGLGGLDIGVDDRLQDPELPVRKVFDGRHAEKCNSASSVERCGLSAHPPAAGRSPPGVQRHQRVQPEPAFRGQPDLLPVRRPSRPVPSRPPSCRGGSPLGRRPPSGVPGRDPPARSPSAIQFLPARRRVLPSGDGALVGRPFPDVPASLVVEPAVGRGAQADERPTLPVGAVVDRAPARAAVVGDLVVLVPGGGQNLVGSKKLGGVAVFIGGPRPSGSDPATQRGVVLDGETVERQVLGRRARAPGPGRRSSPG